MNELLAELSQINGRGTELISVFVPSDVPIHRIITRLNREADTAKNIKSSITRAHVLESLNKTISKLKLYKKIPENGLVLYSGVINDSCKIWEIEPPKPVYKTFYWCSNVFFLDPLVEMLNTDELIGCISIDTEEAGIGIIDGTSAIVIDTLTSGVSGKTGKGGSSARRYERVREQEINSFFHRVANRANNLLLNKYKVKSIVVSGEGQTKTKFLEKEYLDYRLREKVNKVLDIDYAGYDGILQTAKRL